MVTNDGENDIIFIDGNLLEIATAAQVLNNDYQPSDFRYSTDGGNTWIDAVGPNGTVVTIPAGSDSIQVRVFSIADTITEQNEYFTLGVSRVIFGVVSDFADTGIGIILTDDTIDDILF